MAKQLQIEETIDQRKVKTEVVRNVGIPSRLPPAERIVSVNARVEITEAVVGTGYVVINGIIRATIFYVSAEDPSKVVSIRRNFNFTERIAIRGARPGLIADVDALISDINFYIINDRLLGVEFVVSSDVEITAPEMIDFIKERPDIEIEKQEFRIRRQLKERNFTRKLSSVERLQKEAPDIRSVTSIDAGIQIVDFTTDYDQIIIRGIVNNNLLYVSRQGRLEFVTLSFPFQESFVFRGVTPDMSPFVEVNIIEEKAEVVDKRRVRISVKVNFKILVIREEKISIPTRIISPDMLFPVSRMVLIERIVAEERTKILARDQVTIPEGNPDIDRVIRATGRVRGGSLLVEARNGGVLISGIIDANIIYVAKLPDQPVYFTSATIPFSSFIDIPQVTSGMNAYADLSLDRITASKISNRQIGLRGVLDVNILVTEKVRVPIITDISERPITEVEGFITYTVRTGETLYLIAKRFGVSVNRIIQINRITDPNQLRVGQQLLIPRGS